MKKDSLKVHIVAGMTLKSFMLTTPDSTTVASRGRPSYANFVGVLGTCKLPYQS